MGAILREEMSDMKTGLKEEMSDMEAGLIKEMSNIDAGLRKDITDVKLILENEIRVNIQFVAEGHRDLNRRFDEALKVESEKEMLLIRVNMLESEVRGIKRRIEGIA